MIRRNREKYKRSGPESVVEIQKLLNKVRKTAEEVLRIRESAKSLVLALPPVHLTPEPDATASNGSNAQPVRQMWP